MNLNIVDLLVEKLDPGASPAVHANAAAALVGLLGSQNQSNPYGGSPTPLGKKHLGGQLLEPASSSRLLEKTFRVGIPHTSSPPALPLLFPREPLALPRNSNFGIPIVLAERILFHSRARSVGARRSCVPLYTEQPPHMRRGRPHGIHAGHGTTPGCCTQCPVVHTFGVRHARLRAPLPSSSSDHPSA